MDKLTHVYALKARGTSLNGDYYDELRSSTVFTSYKEADKRIEKFKEIVTDHKFIRGLENDKHLEITIIPMEIIYPKEN